MRRELKRLLAFLPAPAVLVVMLVMPIGPLAGGLGILAPVGGIFDGCGLGHRRHLFSIVDSAGTRGPVTVIADQWGIPHIYADSMNDAFMVLGYLHARDRLFQMVMQSRLASGGLSEIIGSAAVTSDKFYRTIGLRRSAELTYQWYLEHRSDSIVDNALSIVEAEVEGVNAFIDSMTSAMTPIEFRLLGLRPEP